MNQFKKSQFDKIEQQFIPLLISPSISDIPNIIAVRDQFDPTHILEFFANMANNIHTIKKYRQIGIELFKLIKLVIKQKGITPLSYKRDHGGYGIYQEYVFARLNKGKGNKEKEYRYISYCDVNYIRDVKSSVLYTPDSLPFLISVFGYAKDHFSGVLEEDFMQYGFESIDFNFFNLLTLNDGDMFSSNNRTYKYYLDTTNVTSIIPPHKPKEIGINDRNGVAIKEFDTIKVKIKGENEVTTTVSIGDGFGSPMVSIPSSKYQGTNYNLLNIYPAKVEYIEVV